MSSPSTAGASRPGNKLLRALPDADYARLQAEISLVPTAERQVFYGLGQAIDYVYFPNGGVASVTTVLDDGRMVESATVGWEGMVGIEAYLSATPISQGEVLIQVPDGNAARVTVKAFRAELAHNGALAQLIGLYSTALLRQMMQSAACNALHQVEQRCARWLLMTDDRVPGPTFKLSHEFLSVMLGVTRPSVTLVAGKLQAEGLISYTRGVVQVLDRTGLEAASCECYGLIREAYDTLTL